MLDPTVRLADPDRDTEALVLLEGEARDALVGQRGGDRWLEEHASVGDGWRERIDASAVFVAHIDDVVVGYLVADLGDDRIVRIDQVWMTPEARELGFGDELLAAAIAHGKEHGAVAVEGQALPGDRDTKNLYERAGITARLITTYREF